MVVGIRLENLPGKVSGDWICDLRQFSARLCFYVLGGEDQRGCVQINF